MEEQLRQLTERLERLEAENRQIMEWKQAKERQQISIPLDDASRNIIGGAQDEGAGSTSLTQSVAVSSTPTNITVPNAYAGSRFIIVGGVRYEFPYLSTS